MSRTVTSEALRAGCPDRGVEPAGSSSRTPTKRGRGRRWLVLGLVGFTIVGFVTADALAVLALRDEHATRTELRDRRAATRRATQVTHDRLRRTKFAVESGAGERDVARWVTAVTQGQLATSTSELGTAHTTSSFLQGRIDALNQCLDGVNQTLGKLTGGDRPGAAATLGFVSPVCNAGMGATGGTAPVLAFDFADPFVLRAGTTFYAYATNAGGGDVQIARSGDLQQWSLVGNALAGLPSWAAPNRTWAPSVLPRLGPFGSYYVLYYAVAVRNGPSCISRATSTSPTGPFVDDSSGPLACPPHGDAIDPSPFVDGNGAVYLTWAGTGARIWSQPLDPSGLALSGEPRPLIGPDQSWERGIVEGPALVAAQGRYYLFYSANKWSSRGYAIGYALCDTPLGPCHKPRQAPVFASVGAIAGPGGQELFTDSAGQLWMAYHAYTEPNVGYPNSRRLHLMPVVFDAAGVPVLRPNGT